MTASQERRDQQTAVLRERLERELAVTTTDRIPTLADLRRLVRAADRVGTPDTAEFSDERRVNGGRILRLRDVECSRDEVPTDEPTVPIVIAVPEGKTAAEIAADLQLHGRTGPVSEFG